LLRPLPTLNILKGQHRSKYKGDAPSSPILHLFVKLKKPIGVKPSLLQLLLILTNS
jgi:hypothetical protein